MTRLPLIVGFGGYNAAGRSSFHHAYRRTVLDSLSLEEQTSTLLNLACMMKLVRYQNGSYYDQDGNGLIPTEVAEKFRPYIIEHTLIRRIEDDFFDVEQIPIHRDVVLDNQQTTFTLARRDLPTVVPEHWQITELDAKTVEVVVKGELSIKMQAHRPSVVQSAGQLPTGFKPADLYASRYHPRGLQMAVLGASDAINSVGIDWPRITQAVAPDQIGVYATSCMGQNDSMGNGGMLQARLKSGRVSSKQLPLGFNSMPADFVNAYVCGNVGTTGSIAGACASFLYNLRLAVDSIKAGKHRVVVVGTSEAPILPEVIEGYAAMSALATDERLKKLDDSEQVDHARASRPFGDNCGFTLGESSQYFVLMDDELAIELGADIYGAVSDVFVNADGYKKSISSPGAGNYITLAKSVAATQAIVGEQSIRERSFVQAHGSSTPQNRVTESVILDKVAQAFNIKDWPVTSVKAALGHPLATASGDQLSSALGAFAHNIIPGIKTIDKVADDVLDKRLNILIEDQKQPAIDVAFLNSKGFGGNNATASVLSPNIINNMLHKRYGADAMASYYDKRDETRAAAQQYDQQASQGEFNVIYHFGENMIDESEIQISQDKLVLPNAKHAIDLTFDNPYADMR